MLVLTCEYGFPFNTRSISGFLSPRSHMLHVSSYRFLMRICMLSLVQSRHLNVKYSNLWKIKALFDLVYIKSVRRYSTGASVMPIRWDTVIVNPSQQVKNKYVFCRKLFQHLCILFRGFPGVGFESSFSLLNESQQLSYSAYSTSRCEAKNWS